MQRPEGLGIINKEKHGGRSICVSIGVLALKYLQDGGQSTPPVHCGNMEKLYGPSPLWEEWQGSNCDKLWIPFLRYEN